MCELAAQAMHTHASPRLADGICASTADFNVTPVHQQGGCFWPVVFSTSMAQRLGCPHSGHCAGSGGPGRLLSCRFMATAIVLQVLAAQSDNGFSQPKEGVMRFLKHTAASKAIKPLLLGLALGMGLKLRWCWRRFRFGWRCCSRHLHCALALQSRKSAAGQRGQTSAP